MHATLAELYGFEGSPAARVFLMGFATMAALAALWIRLSFLQWIMAVTLFFTSLTAPTTQDQTAYLQTWLLPLQLRRAHGHLAMGVLLTLAVVATGRVHMHRVPIQGLIVLAISLYAGFLQFFHEGGTEGMATIGFTLATVPCMLLAAPLAADGHEKSLRMLRAMMLVSVVWTVCASIQFLINPRMVVNTQGRFWGVLANAQQASMWVGPLAIIALWLLLNDTNKRLKILWIGLIAINLLFLGWTGSRTGLLMLLAGGMFVLYNRLGKMVLLLPIAALVFTALAFLSDELQIQSNLDRLTSLDNTRAGVWQRQLDAIAENPLVGVGWKDVGASESSYLAGFAAYGFVMFLLTFGLLVFSMFKCAQLWLRRWRLPKEERPLIDIFISFNAMYFAASFFEGIALARSATTQTMLLMFAGIGVYLTERTARPAAAAEQAYDDGAGYPAAYAYGYEDLDGFNTAVGYGESA